MIEGADWLSTGVLLAGVVATFVRVEQRGKSNREEMATIRVDMKAQHTGLEGSLAKTRDELRADVQAQHTGLESALTKTRNELRADIGILFKTSNEQDKRIERLLSINEQHERRIARAEDHIDKIGGEMGIGRPANGVVR